ncbi:hypothetical protein WICPIJ_009243 [Wickerhamomyces pijperi]|uniref:Secreted protein n=1 Tax=Wickerhamomyces pijperi TaxID=599730 RepID=A0A9P8PQE9_WICPI|nr:hypothetical protein WICPIJ_009243 [Wickerhamomyces pijperi]
MANLSMNGVPGVIALLSQVLWLWTPSSINWPNSSATLSFSSSWILLSLAERNLLARCWFILALGATPSTAIINTLRGLAMFNTRSVYSKIANSISSSVAGAGLSSGWEHGWTIPFISKYKLSSSPFGLALP